MFIEQKGSFPSELLKDAEETYSILNTLLEKSIFAADDEVTIADFCLIASVSTLQFYKPISKTNYPKLNTWVERIKALPCYGENVQGLEQYKRLAIERLKKT